MSGKSQESKSTIGDSRLLFRITAVRAFRRTFLIFNFILHFAHRYRPTKVLATAKKLKPSLSIVATMFYKRFFCCFVVKRAPTQRCPSAPVKAPCPSKRGYGCNLERRLFA